MPHGPLPVSIDRQMLRRVLMNLVRNAVQAVRGASPARTEPGKVRGHVRVSAQVQGAGTALVVEDDGPGIPMESRTRVFDPYFTTKSDGTGLGLAIVKKIVVEHGGTVEVGSSHHAWGSSLPHSPPRPKTRERPQRGKPVTGQA